MHGLQISARSFNLGAAVIECSGVGFTQVRCCSLRALSGLHAPNACTYLKNALCYCMVCCAFTRQSAVAWYYLQLGNRIMAAHVHYDLAKEQRNLGHIRSLFRAPFTTSGLQDRTSIFIVGMPRSGSTLVEQILASHPQVRCRQLHCCNGCLLHEAWLQYVSLVSNTPYCPA